METSIPKNHLSIDSIKTFLAPIYWELKSHKNSFTRSMPLMGNNGPLVGSGKKLNTHLPSEVAVARMMKIITTTTDDECGEKVDTTLSDWVN